MGMSKEELELAEVDRLDWEAGLLESDDLVPVAEYRLVPADPMSHGAYIFSTLDDALLLAERGDKIETWYRGTEMVVGEDVYPTP